MASVLLYAVGEQDIYLSGKPTMTYFQSVYARHTPFLMETYEVPWDNPVEYGFSCIATLPKKADMITGITLKTKHDQNFTLNSSAFFFWPTWPADIPSQPKLYTLQGGALVLTIETIPSNVYYSSYNVPFWAVNYYPSIVTISSNTSSNTFSFSGTTNVYFTDTFSAVFFGMDPRNPDSRPLSSFGYRITTQRNAQLTFTQSGWVPGIQPIKNITYFDGVGSRIVDRAALLLGGQTISETTGGYIDLRNDMDVSLNNQTGLTVLVGKNDTSQQLTSRVCFTRLGFGVDHIPTCALGRQDIQVTIDFAPFSNLCGRSAASDGSLFSANAYTVIDFRELFNDASAWNTWHLVTYKDTMAFDNKNTTKRYFLDMQQSISNVAAYTGPMNPSGAVFPTTESTSIRGTTSKYIFSNIYSVANGSVTRLPTNDYFATNINTQVTATRPIWAYGPLIAGRNQGDGSVTWTNSVVSDARGSSGKYLYYYAGVNYVYLPITGVSTAWYTGSVLPGVFSLTHTFIGTTTPTQASVDEWVLYVKARDPAITTNTTNTNTVSGSNCRVQMTFTSPTAYTTTEIARRYGNNRVVIRYDTTLDMNSSAAYIYYGDFNTIFGYTLITQYGGLGGGGDVSVDESLNLQGDGRYMYQRIKNYIIAIDTTRFESSSGYVKYDWTTLSPVPNIKFTDIVFDSTYGYVSMTTTDGPPYNVSRFRIGSDLSLSASWQTFNCQTSFPWQTIGQDNITSQGSTPVMICSAFDGRYMYYTYSGSGASPCVFRYDTALPFQASSFTWISKHWSSKIYKTGDPFEGPKYNDYKNWVTTDSSGNIFLAAYAFESTHIIKNFDGTTFRTLTGLNTSVGSFYIVKYNITGLGQWVIRIDRLSASAASGSSGIYKIRTDSSGNLYVCGSQGPDTNLSLYNENGTQYTPTFVERGSSFGEGFVFKASSAGAVQWFVFTETRGADGSRSLGETSVMDLSVDGSGNVYFGGTMNGPGGQGNSQESYMNLHSTNTLSSFKQFFSSNIYSDGFIAQCNSSGVLQWASNVSSFGANDFGESVQLTSTGEVFFAGRFDGTPLSIYNADGTLYGTRAKSETSETSDVFMIKYNATTGAVTAASTLTNGSVMGVNSCATDSLGNAYLGVSGSSNVYMYKVDTSTLATTWISRLTAKGHMIVGVDSSNAPYTTCYYDNPTVSVYDSTDTLYQSYNNSISPFVFRKYSDTLMVKYSTAGIPIWSQTIQGASDEFPVGLVIDGTTAWVYAAYLSPKLTSNTLNIIDPLGQSVGKVNGASRLLLIGYSSTTGAYTTASSPNTIGGDDRFISSNGTDIRGVDIGFNGLSILTIGPRYMYMYASDSYGTGDNGTFLQFDSSTFNPKLTSSLLIDYAYMSNTEMTWFQNNTQDYVIECLQNSRFNISAKESYFPLTFDSPIKEFLVTLMAPANQNTYNYSNLTSMALTLNGETLVDQDSTMFQFVEPWETKLSFPTRNVFMYSLCSPVNFSRIRDKVLRVNVPSGTVGTLEVYARTLNVLRYKHGMAGLIFNSRAGVE